MALAAAGPLRRDAFFVVLTLILRRLPCTDDSYNILALSKADHQHTVVRRMSDDDLPPFFNRLILVIENSRQRVGKYSERFLKGYAMSFQVRRSLLWIPRESGGHVRSGRVSRPLPARAVTGLTRSGQTCVARCVILQHLRTPVAWQPSGLVTTRAFRLAGPHVPFEHPTPRAPGWAARRRRVRRRCEISGREAGRRPLSFLDAPTIACAPTADKHAVIARGRRPG